MHQSANLSDVLNKTTIEDADAAAVAVEMTCQSYNITRITFIITQYALSR